MTINTQYIDLISDQIREVYARFGLAVFQAQCLEKELALLLAMKHCPDPTRISRAEFDKIFKRLFLRTFGQLVNEIETLIKLSEDEKEKLKKALSKRNWLAHEYFWERSVEVLSEPGRASMIEELQEAADYFDDLDEFFSAKTVELAEAIGVTQESVAKELERLLREREDL